MPMVRKANCLGMEISSVISVSTSQWCAHRSLAHDIFIKKIVYACLLICSAFGIELDAWKMLYF